MCGFLRRHFCYNCPNHYLNSTTVLFDHFSIQKNLEFPTRIGTMIKVPKQAGVVHNIKPQQKNKNCNINKYQTTKKMHSSKNQVGI